MHLRARRVHALAGIQVDRRSARALGSVRQLRHRLDGGDNRPHSRWPGDIRSRICRHVEPAGVSVEAALAATLLLRGLTFWLPMPPGLWLARREIRLA